MTEFSLIEAENNYVLNRPNFRRSRPAFYPTNASVEYLDDGYKVVRGTCMRRAYYETMPEYISEPMSVYLHQTAFVGKVVEAALINKWKEMGIFVANNFKFYDKDLVLSGEGDVILKNPVTGNNTGIEVKSYYGPKAERNLKGLKKDPATKRAFCGKPKDYQFLQALLYAWEYRNVLSEYRLYYFDRGNGTRFEFEVGLDRTDPTKPCWWRQIPGAKWNMYDPDPVIQKFSVQDIHDRYKILRKYCNAKEVPPKDYTERQTKEDIEYLVSQGEMGVTKYKAWQKDPEKNPIPHFWCDYCNYKAQCKIDKE
jgi:hypothetical protein